MKIFDCFTFFNELDLLDLRLNYLNNIVDYFVLVEADKTHSGKEKPYYYEENKKRYENFHHKIIHVKTELNTNNLSFEKAKGFNPGDNYWRLENEQRNKIVRGLENANPDDMIIISDLDEIPSKEFILMFGGDKNKKPRVAIQQFYYYYLNYRFIGHRDNWRGSVLITKNGLDKSTPQRIRNMRGVLNTYPIIGGWHFSYLGGVDMIINKLNNFAHSEYSDGIYVQPEYIKNQIDKGCCLFTTKKLKIDNTNLPGYLVDNKEKYKKYLKE